MSAWWWNYYLNSLKIVCWLTAYSLLKLARKFVMKAPYSVQNLKITARCWNHPTSARWWKFYVNSLKFICWLAAYSLLKLLSQLADEFPILARWNGYGVAMISRLLKILGLCVEYRLFYRALLHKRPIILRRLLIVATPYNLAALAEITLWACWNYCVSLLMQLLC